jgi:membrane protein YqaA with SNARE-associated domain
MKLFAPLYQKVLQWSAHKKAPHYLASLSFAESSFFPIMPDLMLIPMVLAKPNRWQYLALLTTISSVLGGIFGYLLGYMLFDSLQPYITSWGYQDTFAIAQQWFIDWGIWIVFAAGFSPIPYKVFTITAGALSMLFLPFVIASLIGRGARFFLVAGMLAYFGAKMEPLVLKYIEWLGWAIVIILAILVVFLKFFQ